MSEAMNKLVDGTMKNKESSLKTCVSIRFNRASGSDEIDLHCEKHEDPKISISEQIVIDDDEKLQSNR
jgi:hypothetical protein